MALHHIAARLRFLLSVKEAVGRRQVIGGVKRYIAAIPNPRSSTRQNDNQTATSSIYALSGVWSLLLLGVAQPPSPDLWGLRRGVGKPAARVDRGRAGPPHHRASRACCEGRVP